MFPFYYDWTFIILVPAILFSLYAQSKISGTFSKYLRVGTNRGISGAEAARIILDRNGLFNVPVELTAGRLSDHYDPSKKILRLSHDVYYGKSLASVGVAAHEAGHALQHQQGYGPLSLRSNLVPIANIGSSLSWILIILGFVISPAFINIGILLFTSVVLFQIITLPVEYNASSRAIRQLEDNFIVSGNEIHDTKRVLDAAALTYVAATLTAVLQLVRLLVLTRDSRD